MRALLRLRFPAYSHDKKDDVSLAATRAGRLSIKNLANGPEVTINTGHLPERFPREMPQNRVRGRVSRVMQALTVRRSLSGRDRGALIEEIEP